MTNTIINNNQSLSIYDLSSDKSEDKTLNPINNLLLNDFYTKILDMLLTCQQPPKNATQSPSKTQPNIQTQSLSNEPEKEVSFTDLIKDFEQDLFAWGQDPADIDAALKVWDDLKNVLNNYDDMEADEKNCIDKIIDEILLKKDDDGNDLFKILMDTVVEDYFYKLDPEERESGESIRDFYERKMDDFVNDIKENLQPVQILQDEFTANWNLDSISDWLNTHLNEDGKTLDDNGNVVNYKHWAIERGNINGTFILNMNPNNWGNKIWSILIDKITEEIDDPQVVLLILLLFICQRMSDDNQMKIGGISNRMEKLSDYTDITTALLNKLNNDGDFSDKDGEEFMKALNELKFEIDNDPTLDENSKKAMSKALDDIEQIHVDGGAGNHSLVWYFKNEPSHLNECFNNLAPDPATPEKDISDWNNMINNLNTCSQNIESVNNALSLQVNTLTNTSNQFLAMIKSCYSSINDQNNFFVRNQK